MSKIEEKRKVGRPKTKPEVVKKKDRQFPYLSDEEIENIKEYLLKAKHYGWKNGDDNYKSFTKSVGIRYKTGMGRYNQLKDLRKILIIEPIENSRYYHIGFKEEGYEILNLETK